MTITIEQLFDIIRSVLLIISIVVNVVVIICIKKNGGKGVAESLEKGAATLGNIFKAINIEGVKDVVSLVKDIVVKPTDPTPNEAQNANEGKE